jgi:hypothetical protein
LQRASPTSTSTTFDELLSENMRRDGVSQVVSMKISGRKTDSMERRYNIVDADDMNRPRHQWENG